MFDTVWTNIFIEYPEEEGLWYFRKKNKFRPCFVKKNLASFLRDKKILAHCLAIGKKISKEIFLHYLYMPVYISQSSENQIVCAAGYWNSMCQDFLLKHHIVGLLTSSLSSQRVLLWRRRKQDLKRAGFSTKKLIHPCWITSGSVEPWKYSCKGQ